MKNSNLNLKLLMITLITLILIFIMLIITRIFYPDFKIKLYAKAHINNLNGNINVENFDSNRNVL